MRAELSHALSSFAQHRAHSLESVKPGAATYGRTDFAFPRFRHKKQGKLYFTVFEESATAILYFTIFEVAGLPYVKKC